jgi:signal transduction histidine kinase
MPILINNNFFFIGANLIGMIASYSIEHYGRRDFYMKTLLNEKREHIRDARDMLEERVHERTSQLVEANKRITREMNERIQAEEENTLIQAQLSRQQKMESLGLMAGGVAHDLNNILSGIISYPELLLMDLPEDSKLRKPIQEIQKSGIRAAAVVADLLTVARGVASQYEIVSVNDLVEEYISSPEYKEQESLYPNVSLELNLEADLPNCKCSPVHIQKVLMNLINNGFEAIEITGRITLFTISQQFTSRQPKMPLLDPGEYVLLRVNDNGPGIPAEALQHIFEPFYSKKVMGRSGTGLGLAVVWNTVLEHKGTVNVESNDHGTTFTIYLPVTTEEKQDTTKEKKEDVQGTATVLVVDDERIQRDIGRRILTKLGYKVHTANSGENAVAFLETHAADLVILDMLMDPGMNGYQTYKEIKTLHPGQKAIIVSGFSESDDVKETLQLGASEFVKKPYSVEQIGRVVKRVLLA